MFIQLVNCYCGYDNRVVLLEKKTVPVGKGAVSFAIRAVPVANQVVPVA